MVIFYSTICAICLQERQWKNFDEKYCTEQALLVNIYWYVIVTALVWLPLTIQIICYTTIFVKVSLG